MTTHTSIDPDLRYAPLRRGAVNDAPVRHPHADPSLIAAATITFEWDEDAHPRGSDGRFGDGDGTARTPRSDDEREEHLQREAAFIERPYTSNTGGLSDSRVAGQTKQAVAAAITARMTANGVPARDHISTLNENHAHFMLLGGQITNGATGEVVNVTRENAPALLLSALDENHVWVDRMDPTDEPPHVYNVTDLSGVPVEDRPAAIEAIESLAGPGAVLGNDPGLESALREAATSSMVGTWAASSNDSNADALALQVVAQREFGLDKSAPWPPRGDPPTEAINAAAANPAVAAFLHAQYEETQAQLAAAGITEVTVMRGMNWNGGDVPAWVPTERESTIPVPDLRPLSSWSSSSTTARGFSASDVGGTSLVLTATVPASSVLSTPLSGVGCLAEREWVLLAPQDGEMEAEVR